MATNTGNVLDENGFNVDTCGVDIKDHIRKIYIGMKLFGVGGGCADTYRALLEVAETLRVDNNYPVYTPTGKVVNEMFAEEIAVRALASTPTSGRSN